jgi:inorganic pyrophosphatase
LHACWWDRVLKEQPLTVVHPLGDFIHFGHSETGHLNPAKQAEHPNPGFFPKAIAYNGDPIDCMVIKP